jgi:HK97 family phage major capsid protein
MDLKNERKALWEQAKAFDEKNRDPRTGLVNATAVEQYDRMVAQIRQLADEIARREKQEEMDREIYGGNTASDATGMQSAITLDQGGLAGNAFASASYTNAFNNMIRGNGNIMEVRAALSVGVNKEGGYTVSDEFDRKLVKKLNDHNVLRRIANVMQTKSGEHKIPIAASTAEANWVDEAALIPETSPQFDQISLGANKLAALLLATNSFLRDTMIDVENYVADQFAIALGNKEEAAFIIATLK